MTMLVTLFQFLSTISYLFWHTNAVDNNKGSILSSKMTSGPASVRNLINTYMKQIDYYCDSAFSVGLQCHDDQFKQK